MGRTRRVVVFGAGASHGAREPRPPLGKCLHGYVREYLSKKWDELKVFEDEDAIDSVIVRHTLERLLDHAESFELLANRLWKEGEKDLLAKLNFLMACALTPPINDDPKVDDSFVEKRDVYDEFLATKFCNSREFENWTFITLNYDCLLERAVCRSVFKGPQDGERQCLCNHVNYRFPGDRCSGIEVLKPHGSINWFGNIRGSDKENGLIPITVRVERDGRMSYKQIDVVHSPIGQDLEAMIIARYATEKEAQANPDLLKDIQEIAEERVREAAVIQIIGVHLPHDSLDDPFLSSLLNLMQRRVAEGGCRVDYVSLDREEVNYARSCFGFNARLCSFVEYVKRADGVN